MSRGGAMSRRGDALARLKAAGERNALDAERRDGMRGRFAALASRGSWTDRVAVADNLFPTPPAVAARMVAVLAPVAGERILEPSAGTGRLLDALADTGLELSITVAEQCPRLCRHLYEKYPSVTLRTGDFLGMTFPEPFDAVLMNPPFRRGTDVRHIMRALSLLRPGGRLVSLCYDGAAQAKHLRPIAQTWEPLQAESFRSEGTSADVVMLTLTKEPNP